MTSRLVYSARAGSGDYPILRATAVILKRIGCDQQQCGCQTMRRGGRSIPWPDSECGGALCSGSTSDTTARTGIVGSVSIVKQMPEQLHWQVATSPHRSSSQLSLQASNSVAKGSNRDTKRISSIDLNSPNLTETWRRNYRQSSCNIRVRRILSTPIIPTL